MAVGSEAKSVEGESRFLGRERPLGLRTGIVLAVFALALLYLTAWWIDRKGIAIEILIREPAAEFSFWPFAGFFSHAGVAALFATGVTGLFAAGHAAHDRGLLRAIGVFSLVFAFDDFFMVHDAVLPPRGIAETTTYSVYVLAGLAVAMRWRKELFAVRHIAFFIAVSLLASSVALDVFAPYSRVELFIEDSLKLAGWCVWSAYWIARANAAMAPVTPTETGHKT